MKVSINYEVINSIWGGGNRFVNALDKPTFIFDDYGHEGKTVRNAINDKLSDGTMKLVAHIGEDKGFVAANGKAFIGREGVVCNV